MMDRGKDGGLRSCNVHHKHDDNVIMCSSGERGKGGGVDEQNCKVNLVIRNLSRSP